MRKSSVGDFAAAGLVCHTLSACLLLGCVGTIEGGKVGSTAGAGGGAGAPDSPGVNPPAVSPDPVDEFDPGRVTIRRLNRTEYSNTVRDLLGTALRPGDLFEADPIGFGFDNNGDVQTLTTLQIEQYQGAAETLIAEATTGGLARIAAAARTQPCDLASAGLACVKTLVTGFARRAWRRPVEPAEIERVLGVARAAADRGEDALAQLRLALAAVMSSPHFLFRVELDPDPRSGAAHPLGAFELASRLSYLIYRSMPDDALLEAAAQRRLASDEGLRREVARMLADPKSADLVEGFAGQWLDLESLSDHEVDPKQFSGIFDRDLARAMRAETMRFVTEFLRENLPVAELLSARFTFVDARLAAHYGLPAPGAAGLSRVTLTGDRRLGLLTQGSLLTATSLPNRTSPVTRGAWVLSQLLCAPPPPPPPDVPALPEPDGARPTSGRALLEAHRRDPACAPCHNLIDPIGLGLENYDAIGRWRDEEAGVAIDASGMLPDGSPFTGAAALAALLARDPRVATCAAANLYTYAVSRSASERPGDAAHVQAIIRAAETAGSRVGLRDLVLSLASSVAFRQRRGEPVATSTTGPATAMTSGGQP